MFLPALNYLKQEFPNSYIIFPISKKTCQSAPLFINHSLIDKIIVLDTWESLEGDNLEIAKSCDIRINPFPQHPPCPGLIVGIDNFWWNHYNCCEETFRMAGLDIEGYKKMSPQMQKPRLEPWFPIEKLDKTIAFWPIAAYGKEPKRSPSLDWSQELIFLLLKMGYNVIRFGHPNEPKFNIEQPNSCYFSDSRGLSFFEQIKLSLGCRLAINTDSGSGWVLGAYGHRQISLITNHAPNHYQNQFAFAPENYRGNNTIVFAENSCDNIDKDNILKIINDTTN